ncbi:unnamed protein product [Rhizoctonia solani]|uniref:Uncharacterized protein n=1 Tax=Rhizoctonia solani TaxID=456999 RepID=A0A8H3DMG2_9AGAM|nr:unnamed protein product [Rhizoctonia solani]
MSFRYDLELLSAEDEALLHEDDKPGMRWSIGIPARLVVALARINSLLEDYGSFVDQEVVRELEREIKACKPIVSFTPGEDPALSVGRLMVQESWRLAGYVYLYMGLCGANTTDARVIKVQKQFMGLLESVKSRRNPDVFLVTPILILGIATPSAADQSILLSRLWGVSECIKMGTMGNDIVRILNDIWAHTAGRPAVWNKKCDRTRGPTGCRRCAQSGLECEGYLAVNWRIPRLMHNNRGIGLQTNVTHRGRPERTTLDEITPFINSPVPNQSPRWPASGSAGPMFGDREQNLVRPNKSPAVLVPHQYTEPHSHAATSYGQLLTPPGGHHPVPSVEHVPSPEITQHPTLKVRIPTPPDDCQEDTGAPRTRLGGVMTPGQASLFDSIFSLGNDSLVLPQTPKSPGPSVVHDPGTRMVHSAGDRQEQNSKSYSQSQLSDVSIEENDPDNVLVGLLNELALDREVESNVIPFVAQSFVSWMNRFLFEPARVISLAKEIIIHGQSFGDESHHTLMLLANTALTVSKSTNYERKYFEILQRRLVRACKELTREMAMQAMVSCYELIPVSCKVNSLASVLNLMDLFAPVFRRACPEPSEALVNLPQRLVDRRVSLKLYPTYDILTSMMTHRPMSFRYDLEFLSPRDEELLSAEGGPGFSWSIGAPDLLVITLARMNTFLETHGHSVDSNTVQALEKEIGAFKPILSSNPGGDPSLTIKRFVVQESWRLIGYAYLYMGLCGADANDPRVVKFQKLFMKLLETVRPGRNPDSFLVFPLFVMGIATSSPTDRSILLARLWGVSECNQPGTMGNDLVRMLNDIWARTKERPAVWWDLRIACMRVIGFGAG